MQTYLIMRIGSEYWVYQAAPESGRINADKTYTSPFHILVDLLESGLNLADVDIKLRGLSEGDAQAIQVLWVRLKSDAQELGALKEGNVRLFGLEEEVKDYPDDASVKELRNHLILVRLLKPE